MEQRTDVKIGFKTNTQELKRANDEIQKLQNKLKDFKGASGSGGAVNTPLGRIKSYLNGGVDRGIGQKLVQTGFKGGMRGVGTGLAALGIAGGLFGILAKSISLGKEFTETTGNMVKALDLGADGFDTLKGKIRDHGDALRMGMNELARYEKMYMRTAGIQGGAMAMMRQVRTAGTLARGLGLDPGETTSQFGGLAQAGVFGKMGGISAKEFAAYLADAITSGDMRGRENELISSFQTIADSQLSVLTRLGNVGLYSDLLTGLNMTGQPGLVGMRGAGVLSRLDAGLRNPNGELGELMMWQAMGGADKNRNYFKFKYRQEKGLQNLPAVSGWMRKQQYSPYEEAFYASQMLGVSMQQYMGVNQAMGQVGKSKGFLEALKRAGLGDQDSEAIVTMAQVYGAKDKKQMKSLLDQSGKFSKADIEKIMAGNSKDEILRRMGQAPVQMNQLDEVQKGWSSVENALTDTGTFLVKGLAKSANFLSDVIKTTAEAFIKIEGAAKSLGNGLGEVNDRLGFYKTEGKSYPTDLLGPGWGRARKDRSVTGKSRTRRDDDDSTLDMGVIVVRDATKNGAQFKSDGTAVKVTRITPN